MQDEQIKPAPPPAVAKAHKARWYSKVLEPNTIATIASAIAAIASAFAAIVALLYLAHQEDTAKEQLRATYLSNLYTNQLKTFSPLPFAFPHFQSPPDQL